MGEFESLHLRVKEVDDGGNIGSMRHNITTHEQSHTIHDPCVVRAKGCGKRLKSSKEKSMSRGNRQCGICGQHGHDKRTCPKRNERSTAIDGRGKDDYVEMQHVERDDGTFTSQARDDGTFNSQARDDGTFTSQASSHYDVTNWFF
ncbi:Protein FAR1-RELATED SEQUENCE [Abeliophyllum distichum]|uniref:Protein FAR1-RELATED SEQUENCE n=1 Tax=Abeliophyllum distichum TaxID=126358 RepID=A0ABD1UL88_9LAMI